MRISTFLVSLLLLFPLISSGSSLQFEAQAATNCAGDIQPIVWNETVERQALVPFSGYGGWEFDEMRDGGEMAMDEPEKELGDDVDPALHPEESWMYNPIWPLPVLEPLSTDHYTTLLVGNDSAGVLRFNLSSQHRTTFCISLQTVADNTSAPAVADVYLLTTSQYEMYQESYRSNHFYTWMQDFEEVLSDLSPEWRSFNPAGWNTYRDVHQYENTDEVTFSVSLDGPEVYDSLFDSDSYQDFYLVIDTWDNSHDRDAESLDEVVVADVTVITEERTFILPPWTVPLLFFAMIAALVTVPFILNSRYMNAGNDWGGSDATMETVPMLEQMPVDSVPPPSE
jgi:hypothetical protein